MTPKRNTMIDPMTESHPEAFPTPNTIPTGWDVSAFFEPEQKYNYQPSNYGTVSKRSTSTPYDSSEDTI